MKLILITFLIINIIFIKSFILGRCFVFKQKGKPNLTAIYAVFLGVLFLLYFISIISVVAVSLMHHKYIALVLLAFIAMPFIIGQKATYEKLRFYSNIQLLMLFFSLIATFIILKI